MALTKVIGSGLGAIPAISGANLTGLKAGSAAFMARNDSTSWTTLADEAICPFNNDSTGDSFDTDSVYNTTTYKFVAPAAGVYFFHYSVYTGNADSVNAFGFLKNSAPLDSQHNAGESFSYNQGEDDDHIQSSSVIINLASGDTIAVCSVDGSDFHLGHSHWGGCRLA
tara:strand:- start:110 stop:613 length:504 start_codon:yes stop_codon:yes gene_type:complete